MKFQHVFVVSFLFSLLTQMKISTNTHVTTHSATRWMTSLLNQKEIKHIFAVWLSNHDWTAKKIVWLWIQEFSKNQPKYSVRINWLYRIYNKDSCILYLNYVGYILYISKMCSKLLYIHTHRGTPFFFSDCWLLTICQHTTALKHIYHIVIASVAPEET